MRLAEPLVLLLVGVAVLAGCTVGEGGTPAPVTTTGASAGPTSTTASASDRPREIKLDGLDPCKLFTTDQQKQLGTARTFPESDSEVIPGKAGPRCSYRTPSATTPAFSYNVDLVTGEGIGYWKGAGNLDVSSIEVTGFPARQVTFRGTSTTECSVAVDVADGQQLFVQFLPIGRDTPQDKMCQNAAKGAELALATLQTLK